MARKYDSGKMKLKMYAKKDKSLLQAIESKDKKKIRKIERKALQGEVVRLI